MTDRIVEDTSILCFVGWHDLTPEHQAHLKLAEHICSPATAWGHPEECYICGKPIA